jgi:hypothetical protein
MLTQAAWVYQAMPEDQREALEVEVLEIREALEIREKWRED